MERDYARAQEALLFNDLSAIISQRFIASITSSLAQKLAQSRSGLGRTQLKTRQTRQTCSRLASRRPAYNGVETAIEIRPTGAPVESRKTFPENHSNLKCAMINSRVDSREPLSTR